MSKIVKVTDVINETKEQLKLAGYEEKIISYQQLQELHKKYLPQIEEKTFAMEVLEITYAHYQNMKNKGEKGKILKKIYVINRQKMDEIEKLLIQSGYKGKAISYGELQEMHKKYMPETEERIFATEALRLTYSNYKIIKHRNSRAKILKNERQVDEEKREEIIQNLTNEGYEEKLITYSTLQELHKKYIPETEERIFALEILGLTYSQYKNMQNRGHRGKILKKEEYIEDEKIKQTRDILMEKGYEGKLITYEELQELHKNYMPEIDETKFALDILGITYTNYRTMMQRGRKSRIKNREKTLITNLIKNMNLTEKRFYSKEEVEEICKTNNITIDEFIKYIILNFNSLNIELVINYIKKSIEANGKIWVGKSPISNEFAEQQINVIYELARKIVYRYKIRYPYITPNKDDYIQELVINALQNYGDVEKNFGYDQSTFENVIYNKMKYYLLYKKLEDKEYRFRVISIIKRYNSNQKEFEELPQNKTGYDKTLEEEIQTKLELYTGEVCINRLKELVANGYDKKRALAQVQEEQGLSKAQMISIMTDYINKTKIDNREER